MPAATRRAGWSELLAHPDVTERAETASAIGLMAYHGGLEAGTAEIAAAAAAAAGASLYVVDQPAVLRWHVPSRDVDPGASPVLAAWLRHVQVVITVHGYGRHRRPRHLLLGGRNRELADHVAAHLKVRLAGFEAVTDLAGIPPELRGQHRTNPVNLPAQAGVQVELPPAVRGCEIHRRLVAEALASAAATWPLDARWAGG